MIITLLKSSKNLNYHKNRNLNRNDILINKLWVVSYACPCYNSKIVIQIYYNLLSLFVNSIAIRWQWVTNNWYLHLSQFLFPLTSLLIKQHFDNHNYLHIKQNYSIHSKNYHDQVKISQNENKNNFYFLKVKITMNWILQLKY